MVRVEWDTDLAVEVSVTLDCYAGMHVGSPVETYAILATKESLCCAFDPTEQYMAWLVSSEVLTLVHAYCT